ncbi:MAG: hypothetical protein ABI743_04425 [bacterium]
MNLHLDAHHHAINALLKALREAGRFGDAGQVMDRHRVNDWMGLMTLVEQLRTDPALTLPSEAVIAALESGPLSPGWVPPESR